MRTWYVLLIAIDLSPISVFRSISQHNPNHNGGSGVTSKPTFLFATHSVLGFLFSLQLELLLSDRLTQTETKP